MPEKRLNHADDQQRDILATFPESPAQACDDWPSHEENQEEAEDVISVIDVGADCSGCKKMPEETDNDQ